MTGIETRWSLWAHHPLALRKGTSDADVFGQVFLEREYACLDDFAAPNLVIDCGAYVGYSAAYFLSKWPETRVVAFEPYDLNARQCRANLGPYGRRVAVHRAAIWSHNRGVDLRLERYRDGREWAGQVCEAYVPGLPSIPSVDLNEITPHGLRTLVKMDIEGAEAVVFSAPDLSWLDRIAGLAIEIHDDSTFGKCSGLIADAMHARGFTRGEHGELTVFRK